MPRLIWAQSALHDVKRAYIFLSMHNKDAAQKAVHTIRKSLLMLEKQPQAGRIVEELEERSERTDSE